MKSTPRTTARSARPVRELQLAVIAIGSRANLEREPFVRALLPDLQNRLRTRNVSVVEHDPFRGLDLRAVSAEHVRLTLDEVRRRRPLVVALMSQGESRYVAAEVLLDGALLRYYPWLEQLAHAGLSLPEIVLMEGVLANPLMAGRAVMLARAGEPAGPDRTRRVRARAAAAGIAVTEASDLDGLLAASRDGVLSIVERLFADGSSSSPLEQTRRAQEAFASSRRYAYVPVGDFAERLSARVDGDGPPVLLTGESGSGKSALLANWAFTRRLEEADAFIVEHYAGAESTRSSHVALVRRVIDEIRQRYDVPDAVPVDEREMIDSFPLWLARVQRERLILILDGINQLADGGSDLGWLPMHIPPMVRLIAATTDGPARIELAHRGWEQIRMRPLTVTERRRVVTEFLGDRGVMLDPEQLRRVSDARTSSNPLFLRLRLEELRAPGPLGDLSERIDGYFDATDLEGLFRKVLERLEETHGQPLVAAVLTLLNASRRGLSESELAGMIPGVDESLPALLADLDFHLIRREGLYTFFHDHMRKAVEAQYPVAEPTSRSSPHLRIARYFETQPMSARRADEETWQYRQAGAVRKLRTLIADLAAFMELSVESREYELLGYWRHIGATDRMAFAYQKALRHGPLPDVPRWSLLYRIGVFLYHAGEYQTAETLLARAQQEAREAEQSQLDEVRRHRIALLLELGRYGEVIETCRAILADSEREPDAAVRISFMIALADALHYTGELDEAEQIIRGAVKASENLFGLAHRVTTEAMFNLAILLSDKDEMITAESLLRRVLEAEKRAFGDEHPTVAATLAGLSDVLYDVGLRAEAEQCTRRALEIRLRVLGPDHAHTAHSLNQLGLFTKESGDYTEAYRLFQQAHSVLERHLGGSHPDVAAVECNLSSLLLATGRDAESIQMLEKAHRSLVESLGETHPTTLQAASMLCNALRRSGDSARALDISRTVHAGLVGTLGPDHSVTAAAAVTLADLQFGSGEIATAEELVGQALSVLSERDAGHDSEVVTALVLLAEIHAARGETADAARLASQAIDAMDGSPERLDERSDMRTRAADLLSRLDLSSSASAVRT